MLAHLGHVEHRHLDFFWLVIIDIELHFQLALSIFFNNWDFRLKLCELFITEWNH